MDCSGLDAPYAFRMQSLLDSSNRAGFFLQLKGRFCCVGVVQDCGSNDFTLSLLRHAPGVGFKLDSDFPKQVKIHINGIGLRSFRLISGAQVVCLGDPIAPCTGSEWYFADDTVIIPRPEFDDDLACNFVHGFCGAFSGWSQAASFLSRVDCGHCVGQQFYIDHDEEVMTLWSTKHSSQVYRPPIAPQLLWNPSNHIGICAGIEDWTFFHLIANSANTVVTLSPPCPTWSKGGRSQGLNHPNGWAFVEAIETCAVLQANIVVVECVDEIMHHPHFCFVDALFKQFGFVRIFQQCTPHHHLANHMRTRWLAAWIRCDCRPAFFDVQLTPSITPRSAWHDQAFEFDIPQIWANQLRLDQQALEIYGSVKLLPPAKRSALSTNCSQIECLQARFPRHDEPLPTLCASYSAQHRLHDAHIAAKGVFAALEDHPRGISFFDPARFCSLFGACEEIILPTNLQAAFRCVGNAITVTHSLLPLLLALQAAFVERFDVQRILHEAWAARLTSYNAMLFQQDEFVHFIKVSHAIAKYVSMNDPIRSDGPLRVRLEFPEQGIDCTFCAKPSDSCFQLFDRALKGPSTLLRAFALSHSEHQSSSHWTIGMFHARECNWTLKIRYCCIGSVNFSSHEPRSDHLPNLSPAQVDISPTVAFAPVPELGTTVCAETIVIEIAGIDQIVTTREFDIFLSALESIVWPSGAITFDIAILCPDIAATLTATIPNGAGEAFKAFVRTQVVGHHMSFRLIEDQGPSGVCQSILIQQIPNPSSSEVLSLLYEEGTTAPLLAHRNFGYVSAQTIYNIHHNPLAISTINGNRLAHDAVHCLADLDRIVLLPGAPVRSGGHHGYQGFPCTLQAGADLMQRAEYSINTHGWLASDELFYITQMFDWASDHAIHFTPPVYWDVSASDFEESPYGDLDVAFDQPTIIPVLLQAHWGAIEVLRKESSLDIKLHQIPLHLHHPLVRIVGRRMDIGLNRISFQADGERFIPHLCGWQLIYKWATDLNLFDHIPDITGQFNVPSPETQDLIRMVVAAAIEDWREAQAPPAVALFAAKLRRYFFHAVWTATEQGRPASEHDLLSAFPMHYIQPPEPPQPLPLSSATMRQVITARIESRFDHMNLHAGWLATDELNHFCEFVRIMDPQILIAPASIWCPVRQTLVFPGMPTPEYRPYGHILWPIIYKRHWLQIEVYKVHHTQSVHLMLTAPPSMHQSLNHIVNHILGALNVIPATATITYFVQTTPPGMCGYALIKDVFDRMAITLPEFATQQQLRLTLSEHAPRIAVLQHEARRVWDRSGATNDLIMFAQYVRSTVLLKVISNDFPSDVFAGGMEDSNMSPRQSAPSAPSTAKPDPVWVNDPWKAYKPKQQQSRWEDLILADDHPFKGPDGKPVEQIHRLQASPWRGGIVLSTKSHLPDLLHLDPSNAVLAVVLPAAEPSSFGAIASRLEGPHEVVLKDETSKTSYKRLILLVVVKGKIAYQLPKPTLKFTTVQVAELVLEIDNRFVSKGEFEKYREQPIPAFRKLVGALTDAVSDFIYYGFRLNHHPASGKDDIQLQCIVKIPQASRKPLLEASGRNVLFIRDYLERGQGSLDTSVLPKFWQPAPADLQHTLIETKNTEGAAGIVITKRGLALRVWSDKIGAARTTLLAGDPRITKENKDVVPKHTFEASGWPIGTTAANVVEATAQSTKVPPIPMRTFRIAGVVTWVLAFASKPSITRFHIEVNGTPHEILLQELVETFKPRQGSKGSGKAKPSKAVPPAGTKPTFAPQQFASAATPSLQDTARIDKLEQRFDRIEERQSRFEEKVDGRFEHISDSLRQILQTVGPSRAREVTGETPPPKLPKQA